MMDEISLGKSEGSRLPSWDRSSGCPFGEEGRVVVMDSDGRKVKNLRRSESEDKVA